METLAYVVLILAVLQFGLQAALSGRLWRRAAYAAVAVLAVAVFYPWVVQQPLFYLFLHASQTAWVGNAALVVSIEAAVSLLAWRAAWSEGAAARAAKTRRAARVLFALPTPTFLFATAALAWPYFGCMAGGRSLSLIAAEYALLLGGAVWLSAWLWHRLLKDESWKRELRVLLSGGMAVVSLSAYVLLLPAPPLMHTSCAWDALLVLSVVTVALFILGYYRPLHRLRLYHRSPKK